MAIKITIDNKEINNPLAKFIFSIIFMILALVGLIVVVFVVLPVVWFIVLSLFIAITVIFGVMPRMIKSYRRLERQHKAGD